MPPDDDPQTQLKLSPFIESRLGWSWLGSDFQVRSLDVDLCDDGLAVACGALGRQLRLNPRLDPQAAVPHFLNALTPEAWDTLYGLARMAGGALSGTSIPGPQQNIVTGKPVSRGKIDSAGNAAPTAADGVIAGFGLPSPAIKLGKRFLFANDPAVHFYLYADKDAYATDLKYLVAGGGVQIGGKTSSGTQFKLRVGIGRDTAGGGAGFIKLQIGPDYVPMAPGP